MQRYFPLLAAALLGIASSALAAPGQLGAALALPYLTTGFEKTTRLTVVNESHDNRTLRLQFIDGEPGADWDGTTVECLLLAKESTSLLLSRSVGSSTQVAFECSQPNGPRLSRLLVIPGSRGLAWITLQDPATGLTLAENVLHGSATVSNGSVAGSSFAAEAIAFAGVANDGNRTYTFDGVEYEQPPATLRTVFRAEDEDVRTSLLLAAIDGTVGANSSVRAELKSYDLRGSARAALLDFDCFDLIRLTDIDPNLSRAILDSPVGHLELTSSPRTSDGKTVAFIGWIVEEVASGGQVEGTGPSMDSQGSAARPLRWSAAGFEPSAGDPSPALETF